jgi:uncharacterized membrane protein YccC
VPEWIQLLLGGSLFLGLAALISAFANRRKARTDAAQATVDGSKTLMQYVRDEVEAAVAAAVEPLNARITALEQRQTSMRRIVRRAFEKLISWESRGHPGKMPLPSPAEMEELGIEDLTVPETELTSKE